MSFITAFISYTHDSDAHRQRVLGLAERLRKDGIETHIDQYVNGSPAEGWPRWMLNALQSATYVLCVCTETYARRFRGQEVPGKGKGADWEGALITEELYDARSHSNKFIPILFDGADEPHIPAPLRAQTHYVLDADAGYRALYDALLQQSGVEAGQVGDLRRKPRATGAPLEFTAAPGTPAPDRQQKESPALKIWRDKLEFMLVEEAVISDPAMKFHLKHLVAEARQKIRELGGR